MDEPIRPAPRWNWIRFPSFGLPTLPRMTNELFQPIERYCQLQPG